MWKNSGKVFKYVRKRGCAIASLACKISRPPARASRHPACTIDRPLTFVGKCPTCKICLPLGCASTYPARDRPASRLREHISYVQHKLSPMLCEHLISHPLGCANKYHVWKIGRPLRCANTHLACKKACVSSARTYIFRGR